MGKKSNCKTPLAMAVGAAFAVSTLGIPAAFADGHLDAQKVAPTKMEDAHKMAEQKCGEGKCGDKKMMKKADGKCGEGKCGGDKKVDGKCGEGKCGGDKK